MNILVESELELELLEVRHAVDLYNLTECNRLYLRNWLPWLDKIKTVEDTLSFIQTTITAFNKKSALIFAVIEKKKIIGVAGFNTINFSNKKATIGYWLGEASNGKGIMTKVCKKLIEHGFLQLDLNRIVIACATKNLKSQAIPERLKLTKEGTERQTEWLYDHFVDHHIYSIIRSDWPKKLSGNRCDESQS